MKKAPKVASNLCKGSEAAFRKKAPVVHKLRATWGAGLRSKTEGLYFVK